MGKIFFTIVRGGFIGFLVYTLLGVYNPEAVAFLSGYIFNYLFLAIGFIMVFVSFFDDVALKALIDGECSSKVSEDDFSYTMEVNNYIKTTRNIFLLLGLFFIGMSLFLMFSPIYHWGINTINNIISQNLSNITNFGKSIVFGILFAIYWYFVSYIAFFIPMSLGTAYGIFRK